MPVFVFLHDLGAGLAVSLAVVRLGPEGRKFFLFNAGLAFAVGGLALTLRLLAPPGPLAATPAFAAVAGSGYLLLAVYLVAGALGAERRRLERLAAAALGLSVLIDARALHASVHPPALPGASLLHVLNAGTSAWLAGSILLAMILGHFYLVIPRLSIDPLRRLFRFALAGLGARTALVLGVGLLWWMGAGREAITVHSFLREGVFVLQRVLFGLAIPVSLAWFTWKTIEMRSTQSATGILYVVVFLTLVGEALSVYLSLETGVPI